MSGSGRAGRSGRSGRSGSVWAVVAGGGTGGHVVPAIAIGRAMVQAGHPAGSILFVGSRRGMEARMVPEAGFEVVLLPGRGIARRLTPDNLGALAGLFAAAVQALILIGRRRPAVVVSVGGYASAAAAFAAIVWRVPLIVAEQNAWPGLVNRVVGRAARACAVSFPGTPLPKAVLTGNPVRPEILAVDRSPAGRAEARARLGLPEDRLVVAAAGGSLGARRINEAVLSLVAGWAPRRDVAVRHVVGRRDFDEFSRRVPPVPAGGIVYEQVPFEDRMDLLLTAADVMVGRAGASTVAELAVAGLPAVLVPLPGAPGDHQTVNARRLAEAGAAVVLADADCDGAHLAERVESLLADGDLRSRMSAAALAVAHPDAAAEVARLAQNHARD